MSVYIQTLVFSFRRPAPEAARLHALRGDLRLGGGHVGLAECDGQLQVLLLLPPQPRQPLLLRPLALPLGPRQLLLLIAKRWAV